MPPPIRIRDAAKKYGSKDSANKKPKLSSVSDMVETYGPKLATVRCYVYRKNLIEFLHEPLMGLYWSNIYRTDCVFYAGIALDLQTEIEENKKHFVPELIMVRKVIQNINVDFMEGGFKRKDILMYVSDNPLYYIDTNVNNHTYHKITINPTAEEAKLFSDEIHRVIKQITNTSKFEKDLVPYYFERFSRRGNFDTTYSCVQLRMDDHGKITSRISKIDREFFRDYNTIPVNFKLDKEPESHALVLMPLTTWVFTDDNVYLLFDPNGDIFKTYADQKDIRANLIKALENGILQGLTSSKEKLNILVGPSPVEGLQSIESNIDFDTSLGKILEGDYGYCRTWSTLKIFDVLLNTDWYKLIYLYMLRNEDGIDIAKIFFTSLKKSAVRVGYDITGKLQGEEEGRELFLALFVRILHNYFMGIAVTNIHMEGLNDDRKKSILSYNDDDFFNGFNPNLKRKGIMGNTELITKWTNVWNKWELNPTNGYANFFTMLCLFPKINIKRTFEVEKNFNVLSTISLWAPRFPFAYQGGDAHDNFNTIYEIRETTRNTTGFETLRDLAWQAKNIVISIPVDKSELYDKIDKLYHVEDIETGKSILNGLIEDIYDAIRILKHDEEDWFNLTSVVEQCLMFRETASEFTGKTDFGERSNCTKKILFGIQIKPDQMELIKNWVQELEGVVYSIKIDEISRDLGLKPELGKVQLIISITFHFVTLKGLAESKNEVIYTLSSLYSTSIFEINFRTLQEVLFNKGYVDGLGNKLVFCCQSSRKKTEVEMDTSSEEE